MGEDGYDTFTMCGLIYGGEIAPEDRYSGMKPLLSDLQGWHIHPCYKCKLEA